jgi:hypothetical protein
MSPIELHWNKFRKKNYEIKMKPKILEQFPTWKGRKMYLIRWTKTNKLLVLINGLKHPVSFHPDCFADIGDPQTHTQD